MVEPEYTKAYKVTIWFGDGAIRTGYRYLPDGKVAAMKVLRPEVESLENFYHVLGYKIENGVSYKIPESEVKSIKTDGLP